MAIRGTAFLIELSEIPYCVDRNTPKEESFGFESSQQGNENAISKLYYHGVSPNETVLNTKL